MADTRSPDFPLIQHRPPMTRTWCVLLLLAAGACSGEEGDQDAGTALSDQRATDQQEMDRALADAIPADEQSGAEQGAAKPCVRRGLISDVILRSMARVK